jgi:ATP-dependent Clp protease protease subunit
LLRDKLNEVLAHHTGQPVKRIAKDTDRDFFMSAEEALEYGIVDNIFKHRTDIPSKDGSE